MSDKDDLQKLINESNRRLQKLKEQKAKYGASAPPEILIEIEDLEREIGTNQQNYESMASKQASSNQNISDGELSNYVSLLEAMGYEILDKRQVSSTNMFLVCHIRMGLEVQNSLASIVTGIPHLSDYERLRGAISRTTYSGFLISSTDVPTQIKEVAKQDNIRVYSYKELITQIIDFGPYLKRLAQEFKGSDVLKYYTNIHCILPDGTDTPLDQYVRNWIYHPRNRHLSVLGGFGTGKTWFCYKLLADQAQLCLENPNERIPILVSLRDYSKAYDIVQVITDLFANRLKIGLPAGYDTFDFLNKSGRFLLIFDGLDEMERRISDYQAVAENFWELARLAKHEKSKIILTCRNTYFRNELEEKEVLVKGGNKVNVIGNEEIHEIGSETPYTKISLRSLSSQEIREILKKRLGYSSEAIWNTILTSPDLFDLARRPSLIDMLIQVIPDMGMQKDRFRLNLARLFERYIDHSLKIYDDQNELIGANERLTFLEELSWEMYVTQQASINWSEFPSLVSRHLSLSSTPESILFYEKALRSQSYLARDKLGNYSFAHKSFMEFFVGKKVFKALNSVDISSNTLISQLEPNFIQLFGQVPFTIETRNFIKQFLQEDSLLENKVRIKLNHLLEATKSSQSDTTKYLGGNAISILHMLGESFRGRDLGSSIIKNADLRNADLTKTSFKKANLFGAILSNATLNEADLSQADLTGVNLEGMKTVNSIDWSPKEDQLVISCDDMNIKVFDIKPRLENRGLGSRPAVLFGHENPVLSVCWSPSDRFIASIDSERNIIVWNSNDLSIVRKWQSHDLLSEEHLYQPGHISRQIFFSRNNDEILVGNSQLLIILDILHSKPIEVLIGDESFKETTVDQMSIGRDESIPGQKDWIIKYPSGIRLSRLQHKNIAFERRTLIADRGKSELSISDVHTAMLSEESIQVIVTENSALKPQQENRGPTTKNQTDHYISPEFENSKESKLLPVDTMTTAVYSPSKKYFAYGAKSSVIITDRGFQVCELDLSLSCEGLNVAGATGLSPSVLLALDSKSVKLDETQTRLWRKAKDEEKEKLKPMNTGILTSFRNS